MRGERISVACGCFAEDEFERLFGSGVAFWFVCSGGRDFIESGEEEIAEAGFGAMGETPDVAEFLAKLTAVFVSCRRVEEGKGAGIFGDGERVVFFEFVEFAKFFSSGRVGEEGVADLGIFASGSVVVELGFKARANEKQRGLVAFLFVGPFFGRDARRFFVVGRIADIFDDAGRVVDGAAEAGFVARFFEELNGEERNGHIFRSEGDKALGVRGGFGSVAELEAGFDESAEDLRAFGSLRIFLEKVFEIADKGGAIVACGFDGLLKFVGGRELFGSGLFFCRRRRVLRCGLPGQGWC